MIIKEVGDKKVQADFHQLVFSIYKGDPEWVCPLFNDIEEVFDPARNLNFQDGKARRWVLYDDHGTPVGRIAAFYSRKLMGKENDGIGGIGFFECINDSAAAALLFRTAESWLQQQEIKGVDAPINFGERDKFWGLLVEGFKNPSYQENYNPPYYQALFEENGYVKLIEQSTSELHRSSFNKERFGRLAQRVLQNPKYHFEHYRRKNKEKYADDFVEIYNQAWQHHEGFTPLNSKRVLEILQSLNPILEEDIIIFAYADGKPAGIYVNVIHVNGILKHLDGRLNLWGKLKFFWYRNFSKIDRIRGTVFGIIPQYHNTGLETGMIWRLYETVEKRKDMEVTELAWIGDFNQKMHSMLHSLGAVKTKVHYTYRKLFGAQTL